MSATIEVKGPQKVLWKILSFKRCYFYSKWSALSIQTMLEF